MTEKQRTRFYFPAWNVAVKANGWHMKDCRLQIAPAGRDRLSDLGRTVVAEALRRAGSEARGPRLDDLRHACHVVALGRDKSSAKLDNREVDKVVALFRLLTEETDIAAGMRYDNPDIGERERLKVKISRLKIPHAKIDGVCRRGFAPVYSAPYWEDLPLASLRALFGILQTIQERKPSTINHQPSTPF
jgi:hypothetical protein